VNAAGAKELNKDGELVEGVVCSQNNGPDLNEGEAINYACKCPLSSASALPGTLESGNAGYNCENDVKPDNPVPPATPSATPGGAPETKSCREAGLAEEPSKDWYDNRAGGCVACPDGRALKNQDQKKESCFAKAPFDVDNCCAPKQCTETDTRPNGCACSDSDACQGGLCSADYNWTHLNVPKDEGVCQANNVCWDWAAGNSNASTVVNASVAPQKMPGMVGNQYGAGYLNVKDTDWLNQVWLQRPEETVDDKGVVTYNPAKCTPVPTEQCGAWSAVEWIYAKECSSGKFIIAKDFPEASGKWKEKSDWFAQSDVMPAIPNGWNIGIINAKNNGISPGKAQINGMSGEIIGAWCGWRYIAPADTPYDCTKDQKCNAALGADPPRTDGVCYTPNSAKFGFDYCVGWKGGEFKHAEKTYGGMDVGKRCSGSYATQDEWVKNCGDYYKTDKQPGWGGCGCSAANPYGVNSCVNLPEKSKSCWGGNGTDPAENHPSWCFTKPGFKQSTCEKNDGEGGGGCLQSTDKDPAQFTYQPLTPDVACGEWLKDDKGVSITCQDCGPLSKVDWAYVTDGTGDYIVVGTNKAAGEYDKLPDDAARPKLKLRIGHYNG
jgi:hypothetical protein